LQQHAAGTGLDRSVGDGDAVEDAARRRGLLVGRQREAAGKVRNIGAGVDGDGIGRGRRETADTGEAGQAVEGNGAGCRVTEVDVEVVGVGLEAGAVVEGDTGAGRGVGDGDFAGERRYASREDKEDIRAVPEDVGIVRAAPGVAGENEL
jgi:hypothetical protein